MLQNQHITVSPTKTQTRPDPSSNSARISIMGLGYVGLVSAACLSSAGHRVIGVDTSESRVNDIKDGNPTIHEIGLDTLLEHGRKSGRLSATLDAETAMLETDVTFISVGTPTGEDGGCDMSYIHSVARTIGHSLRNKEDFHLIVMRCSIPPGTTQNLIIPEIEEASGKQVDKDFGVCFNPEFLREGTAIHDFLTPPQTVIGASSRKSAKLLKDIYWFVDGETEVTSLETAEMLKYADNTWHAVKVGFANEIGRFCKSYEIDSHDVMNLFIKDTKLNISPYYLKPGFAFGGSCLPKEVRAMQNLAADASVEMPIIDHVLRSNDAQIRDAERQILALMPRRVGFLGVTFKPGTDDLRESPILELMARLRDRGVEMRAYDQIWILR